MTSLALRFDDMMMHLYYVHGSAFVQVLAIDSHSPGRGDRTTGVSSENMGVSFFEGAPFVVSKQKQTPFAVGSKGRK